MPSSSAELVWVFGSDQPSFCGAAFDDLRRRFPAGVLFGCSTAGEVLDERVFDDSVAVTAVSFERSSTRIQCAKTPLASKAESFAAGAALAHSLEREGLRHIFVLADGIECNGSDLVRGLRSVLPQHVTLSGGLAGDGTRFGQTFVMANDRPASHMAACVGLYGDDLELGFGSMGGWDPFGPLRRVTRAEGNVLFELDGQPALSLYRAYLGEAARDLPASGLLFPLSIRTQASSRPVVRTIVGINPDDASLTFVGDVPQGSIAQLMKANFDRLIDGASDAALSASSSAPSSATKTRSEASMLESVDLAILVSCVGRKLVLKQRTEEEVEAVRAVLGPKPFMTGFYSYGEICSEGRQGDCDLHNQTMTVTTFRERA